MSIKGLIIDMRKLRQEVTNITLNMAIDLQELSSFVQQNFQLMTIFLTRLSNL